MKSMNKLFSADSSELTKFFRTIPYFNKIEFAFSIFNNIFDENKFWRIIIGLTSII